MCWFIDEDNCSFCLKWSDRNAFSEPFNMLIKLYVYFCFSSTNTAVLGSAGPHFVTLYHETHWRLPDLLIPLVHLIYSIAVNTSNCPKEIQNKENVQFLRSCDGDLTQRKQRKSHTAVSPRPNWGMHCQSKHVSLRKQRGLLAVSWLCACILLKTLIILCLTFFHWIYEI